MIEPDKTVIEMAREAGFVTLAINEDTWGPYLERFAELVREEEREAIAKEFDLRAVYADGTSSSGWYEPDEPAQIIRNRGQA
jgi:hypothetical protein